MKSTVGHIVNLLSNDVEKLDRLFLYPVYLLIGPLHLVSVGVLLWQIMGPSSLTGIAVMLLGIPLQGTLHCFVVPCMVI
jgi:hypothetical protein